MYNSTSNQSQEAKKSLPNTISKRTAELLRCRYELSKVYVGVYEAMKILERGDERKGESILWDDKVTGFFPFFNKTSALIEDELLNNILVTMEKTNGQEI